MTADSFGDHLVTSIESLEALYGVPKPASLAKEIDHVSDHYRALIEAAPFMALATSGPDGLDCTPRGDAPGFVQVQDARTLLVPDRRGNNRIDSLRNLIRDPRIALLFLIPGCAETLRVNGRAAISADPALAARFVVNAQAPRTVLVVTVERIYFQCAKAIVRSRLWDPARHVDRASLPSVGTMLAALSGGQIGGEIYDRAAPEQIKAELY
jgi:uncharacterized protein